MTTDFVVAITGVLTCTDIECHDYVEDLLVDMTVAMEERGYSEASFGAEFGIKRFTGSFVVTAADETAAKAVAEYLLHQVCAECRGEFDDEHGDVLIDEAFKAEHLIVWNGTHVVSYEWAQ